jgi:hypothetical protein
MKLYEEIIFLLNGDITEMDAVGMYNEFLKKNK